MKLSTQLLLLFLAIGLVVDIAFAKKDEKKKRAKGEKEDVKVESEVDEMDDETKFMVTKTAYLDIEVDDEEFGKVVIALFGEAAPNTANNFAALSKGNYRGEEGFGYKGSLFHRVIQDFIVQGGDITVGDGSGGKSIYGPVYNDEPFIHKHIGSGYAAMANRGPDTNNSQFFIIMNKARWLDNKHVVFGKVIEGMDVVERIADLETNDFAFPKKLVRISDAGMIKHKPYVLPKEMR